jgi:exopolysaccharide biosynthesis polyprenyl glycosylphosphotransferase
VTRRLNPGFPIRSVLLGLSEAFLATLALLSSMIAYLGPLNARLALTYDKAEARVALVVILFVLCMYYFDLYNLSVLRNSLKILTNLIQCAGAFLIVIACIYWLFPGARLQQQIVLVGTGSAAIGALCWRQLFRHVSHWPAFQDRVLILGEGQLGNELAQILQNRPELGYRVVYQLAKEPDTKTVETLPKENGSELRRVVEFYDVRRIVVTMDERRGRLPVDVLLDLKKHGVVVQDGSELYENITGKVYLQSLRPSMLLFSPAFEVSAFSMFSQRLLSLLISIIALLVAAPVMMLIAVAIKIDSPGPVIFRQKRVGLHGKLFTLYKFRSMRDGADGIRPAEERDERFTRLGLWLRSSRLDELPQLWNIVRSDMHLVGPRPFVPEQEDYLRAKLPFYQLRWSVPPGATGWAQVSRGYCSTLEDNADKLACDLFYIKHFSLSLDLLVLLKTAKTLVLGRGAQ